MEPDSSEPALGPGDLPERIEVDGLVVRRWTPDDLDARYRAIIASFDHLHPWMEWAAEPPSEQEHRDRFERALRWPSDRGYNFGVFDQRNGVLLALEHVDRVEIHCDQANVRSAAVPERLGYRLDRIDKDQTLRATPP